ncbi:LarC family nickel insertion protein [Vibrio superstes]|uniref:UPF0272 protein n=1 Tax=Vibrio superstes NBRC 103154 TaxID=1219062 RepID=A0A511QP51_9VIBR|nr:LarC family nickel insertion protein [Vibrio superstes]GEM79094.1 UPF0272 protein [Vibrio superstes NBRC 103154]
MHIHLDLVGGIAGDMFTAAILDAAPELKRPLFEALEVVRTQTQVKYWTEDAMDKGLSGQRFYVEEDLGAGSDHHHHHHHGEHRSWKSIKKLLIALPIEDKVRRNAIGIFELLAQAEAGIHGKSVDDVHFHEVGAWDCIIDIVSASWLIEYSRASSWSCSKIPWGGGTVRCAHGEIPVPAPATLTLLKGFTVFDDGIKGERVTPTGAAILAWLRPSHTVAQGCVSGVGYGFGKRKLTDRANLLRASFLSTESNKNIESQEICVVQFDIDDMTGEMLAIARERIREQHGVHEITEAISHGKKNRHISTFTLLASPSHQDSIIEYIFNNTSTLGVRYWSCMRKVLPRLHHTISSEGQDFEVKTVTRPDGSITSKLESDHLGNSNMNYQSQTTIKSHLEAAAVNEKSQS